MLKRIVVLLSLAVLSACNPSNETGLAISPSRVTVTPGLSQTVEATVLDYGVKRVLKEDVEWSVDPSNVATISEAGELTGVEEGDAKIVAKYKGMTATAQLTVESPVPVISYIAIEPRNFNLRVTEVRKLTVKAFYTDNHSEDVTTQVTWSVSNPTLATAVAGEVTGLAVSDEEVKVTAKLNTHFDTATLHVRSGAMATAVKLVCEGADVACPAALKLPAKGRMKLKAFATIEGAEVEVTSRARWASADSLIASVSNDGAVTAGEAAGGPVAITATFDGLSASLNLSVLAPEATLVSITVKPSPTKVLIGGAPLQLVAMGRFSDDQEANVTSMAEWTSEKTELATVSNEAPTKGEVTGLVEGPVKISAKVNQISGSADVTVGPPALLRIAFTNATSFLRIGQVHELKVEAIYSGNIRKPVTAAFESSDSAKVTVTPLTGVLRGIAAGFSDVTARFEGKEVGVRVTVTTAVVTELKLTATPASVVKGRGEQIEAYAKYDDGTTRLVTGSVKDWTSSDPTKLSILNTGYARGLSEGDVKVSGIYETVKGELLIKVTPPEIDLLTILSVETGKLLTGKSRVLTATATYSDGSRADVTQTATWSASTLGVATVSQGVVKATRDGFTKITVSVPANGPVPGASTVLNLGVCGIVIGELQVQGAGGPGDEFVEIRNTCDFAVDLTGHRISYRATGANGSDVVARPTGSIGPNGRQVFGGAAFTLPKTAALTSGRADWFASTSGGVAVFSPSVALPLDSVGYGPAANIYVEGLTEDVPAVGQSMQRANGILDTNNNQLDFTTRAPTPGT